MRTNFQYVFKDIMDLDHFEENMLFSDPISKFTFFRGNVLSTYVVFHKNSNTDHPSNVQLSIRTVQFLLPH